MVNLLAAFVWDPQIRGAVIVLTAFVILVGSVYLLLGTNLGSKLGFLVAAAGLFGWMAVMGWIWVLYGIGIKGDPPHWKVREVVTGPLEDFAATDAVESFPQGWNRLPAAGLGDAAAAADHALAGAGGEGEAAAAAPSEFPPIFESPSEYAIVGGYSKGGESYWIPGGGLATDYGSTGGDRNIIEKAIDRLKRGPFHAPRYAVVQVQPVLDQVSLTGAPVPPEPDPTQPVTSVVMVRDLGNLRQPSALFGVANTILFALAAWQLHRRDKQIMALRAQPAAAG